MAVAELKLLLLLIPSMGESCRSKLTWHLELELELVRLAGASMLEQRLLFGALTERVNIVPQRFADQPYIL